MSAILLPGGVLLASLAMTYYFCLQPMRRGHCGLGEGQRTDVDLELALLQARLDLARLEARLGDHRGGNAGGVGRPSVVFDEEFLTPPEQIRRAR